MSFKDIVLVDGQKLTEVKLLHHIEARIMAEGDCLVWTGTKNIDGYGRMFLGWNEKRQPIRRFAHRIFYELVNGRIPDGLDIDHLCRNRACANPDHLEAVTRSENVRRGLVPQLLRDKAAAMTHCKRGHLYIEENKIITNKATGAKSCRICINNNRKERYMKKKLKAIRHGEVMLVPITKHFTGQKHSSYIVGHSETQHHHVLESKKPFVVSQSDKEFLIELFEPAKLVHKKQVDKHKTLPVAPGRYKIIYKNEYNPWEGVISRVFD
jgi:hypothetical protein